MDAVVVREIVIADAEAVARLSEELGYPVATDAMRQRIAAMTGTAERAVFVACIDETVVGWIDVAIVRHLQAENRAEIGGLVVASGVRSLGIGRHLLARAERWAAEAGLKGVIVRSRVEREAAHRFYLREGYRQSKLSAVFTKALG